MKKTLLITLTLVFATVLSPVSVFACGEGEVDEYGQPLDCSEEIEIETESSEESIEEVPSLISGLDISEESTEDEAETYVASGATVSSSRDLMHSLFLVGNDIVSNDTIDGISFAAGNLVKYIGSAEYAFLAGNTVTISGTIGRDLFAAGNSVTVDEGASIGRDLFVGGNSVILRSMLYGNAFATGNRITLENVTIDGDLTVDAGEIVINGQSAISGKFKYNDNAKIIGLENLAASETEVYSASSPTHSSSFASVCRDIIIDFLGILLLTVVLIALAPKFAQKLLDTFHWKTSWKFLGLGLGLIVLVPIISIFVIITVIGLPLGGLALGLYFAFICLSQSITGGIIGNELTTRLFKKQKLNIYLKYIMGLAILRIVEAIPVLGGFVLAISVCFGFAYLAKRIFVRK